MASIIANIRYLLDKYTILSTMVCGPLLPLQPLAKADLRGKNMIVTGSNSGLGLEIALKLASMNANVFLACRNTQKASDAREGILKQYPDASVHALSLDTSTFRSVREFATNWSHGQIDALLHNAGIAAPQGEDKFSEDGLEIMYQTNFLGSFVLTQLLEEKLAPDARVILTSSMAALNAKISDNFSLGRTVNTVEADFHTIGDGMPIEMYAQYKLMQIAFARALQERFDRDPMSNRLAFSWEPGLVRTPMENWVELVKGKDPGYALVHWLLQRTAIPVEQGAATALLLAVGQGQNVVEEGRGQYWSRCGVRMSPASFFSQEKLDKLWARWSADAGITWT